MNAKDSPCALVPADWSPEQIEAFWKRLEAFGTRVMPIMADAERKLNAVKKVGEES